ncbi:MAG: alcohol dehydrogenase catalytic domain-containing protein, partial [Rhodobacteraceae bacterium]|nr:alcohol dehydrogenase catalytic domain-containing protein [Paracoccaceae bacterium]
MQAWLIETLGDTPNLVTLPTPDPAPGEVLVRVIAVGLNFADLLMQAGSYQARPPLPYVPGMEFAGIVAALGPGTSGPEPGTRVLGICG